MASFAAASPWLARVFGIEENRQAIEDAERNARLNNVPSSRVRFSARAEDAVRPRRVNAGDGVVLDPAQRLPRRCASRRCFADLRSARVTYVSCNPESLAMELPGILQCGSHRVTQLNAVDMFPHTDHIEAIVQLSRDLVHVLFARCRTAPFAPRDIKTTRSTQRESLFRASIAPASIAARDDSAAYADFTLDDSVETFKGRLLRWQG